MEAWKIRLYDKYVSTGQAMGLVRDAVSDPQRFDTATFPHLMSALRRVLPARHDARILDLACGHGPLLMCARALGYTQLAGVDISQEQVTLARSHGLSEVICEDIYSYLEKKTSAFDVVFAMDVLEHLTKPELLDVLDRVVGALAPGGLLVVHVPNAAGLFGMRVRYGDLTHETAFTEGSMTQLLRATGFTEISCNEEQPHVHGFVSALRLLVWRGLTVFPRLLLAAETGSFRHLLSQNILVTARRASSSSI